MGLIERVKFELANQAIKKVIFTEGSDLRILKAAVELINEKICQPIILDQKEKMQELAEKNKIDLSGVELLDAADENLQKKVIYAYLTADPVAKSEKRLQRLSKKSLNLSMMMTKAGMASCSATGVVTSTTDVIIAAQQLLGVTAEYSTISSIGFQQLLTLKRTIGVADCAINLAPNAEELADIVLASADSYQKVTGDTPRIALLSYSTFGSGAGPQVDLINTTLEKISQKNSKLMVEGEMQIDAALLPEIAKIKVKRSSRVAGRANLLVFPDLAAGNIAVKCMQMFDHGTSFGPLLQGFQAGVTDFSRAATVADIVGNVCLTLIRGKN
ncbi:phosphate acetyltransferase [Liquorilactobacillus ghanensis DSM 18630]|uniref:Phosphate acetyltransferase n=1 Tax=Liquorilactobacillus ghanensis DSM 18630 TaxID=1423750 RepID=A0A0R1VMA3_9LACO|nr:phosphate acyltransferase [Liquorilactobacillus ghanensis]KRM04035.1 phosphate acetyltransferase [Liquorilactobacillus ghanensis DSM 18630]